MENSRLNGCQHWQMPEYPGNVAQYPQGVMPAYQPINYVPHVGGPGLSVGLQNRTIVQHNPDHFYQQVVTAPMSTIGRYAGAQIVEKYSETTSGSLVEYTYLPPSGGGFLPLYPPPAVVPERNSFSGWHHAMSPVFWQPPVPSCAPLAGNIRHVCPAPASENRTVSSSAGTGNTVVVQSPSQILPGNVAQRDAAPPPVPESSSPAQLPPQSKPYCALAGIDLIALIPEPHPESDLDKDMKLLYLKHLGASQLPRMRQPRNFLARVRGNFTLHNNRDLPRFDERQQMIASLARHFEDTDEFQNIGKNNSYCTTMLKKMHKQRVFLSDAITPEHCILLCIAPFLPCTPNHSISLRTQYLRQYKIPFSSIESLMTASAKSQELLDVFGDELLRSDNGSNQLGIILQVMAIMAKTFVTKLQQLKTDGQNAREVVIHSKFVAHMVLTALLYCQHDTSTQNISRFLSVTGYFLKHLAIINRYPNLCDEAFLELIRATLTLLNHNTAKTELLALMHGSVRKTEPPPPVNDQNTRQRLQQKFRSKNDLSPPQKPEDSLASRGRMLAHSLQTLVIATLRRSLELGEAPHYFATLTTLSALPLFSPILIRQESDNCQKLISHLSSVINWMVHSLQQDSRCYTDYAQLRKINDTMTTVWIPALSFQVATLAGWQPCVHLGMSHKQWLFNQLRAPAGGKLKHTPDLLMLVRRLYQLEQESLRTMIEEDKMSREFDAEANALAKQMDELSYRKTRKIAAKSPKPTPHRHSFLSRFCHRHNYEEPAEQPPLPSPPLPAFIGTVADFCREQDYSQELAALKAAIPQNIKEKLDCASHQLWLYTEMAFQGFHQHRELIIRSANAMDDAWRTQRKLTRALAEPKTEFASKQQSSGWLNERFTPSELSPKRLAQLARETEPEKLARARRVMGNVLALFKLAIKPGQTLLEEMSNNKQLTGDLPPHELIIHFDICHEAMLMLVGRFKGQLERKVISHEIPGMKTQLFEQLHLYGTNSFAHSHHSPEDSEWWQALKTLESDAYREYNQQSFDKIDAQDLLIGYRTIRAGLFKYCYHLRNPPPVKTLASMPEVPGPDPTDQQGTNIDANTSEHQ